MSPRKQGSPLSSTDAEQLSNDEILATYEVVAHDIIRRLRNYGRGSETPLALLDGVKFAKRARSVSDWLAYDGMDQEDECGNVSAYRLYDAQRTLTDMMADFEEVA